MSHCLTRFLSNQKIQTKINKEVTWITRSVLLINSPDAALETITTRPMIADIDKVTHRDNLIPLQG